MLTLSETSKLRLTEVHPDLQKVVNKYLETGTIPITILEGKRDLRTQKEYVRKGVSQTLRSRHLTGHAVDIAPIVDGKASFAWPVYYRLAPQMKRAAKEVGVPLEWGGDWHKFKDGPHWQLPWKKYPLASGVKSSGISEETERQSKTKKSIVIAASGSAFPLTEVANTLASQQEELSSGDITRLVIAGVIVALTLAGLVWTWRD